MAAETVRVEARLTPAPDDTAAMVALRRCVSFCEELEAEYQKMFDRTPSEMAYGSKHAASECAQACRAALALARGETK